MASLHDVARLAGVSKSTVSRVINDEYGVKEATKVKVKRAIEECGYVVNQVAKDLKSNKTNSIGIIVPRVASNATSQGVDGLSEIFEQAGKQVLLANSRLEPGKELQYIELFNQKRVEGIVMFATHIDDELVAAIKRSKAPVVLIGQDGSGFNIPSVIHDDYRVGYCAGEFLSQAGCKHVGFLGVQSDDIAVDQQRFDGFSTALKHLAAKPPKFHSQGQFSIASGRQEMANILSSNQQVDGVFCATDRIAIGAMQAIAAAGLVPGKDIKVIGVGNDEMAAVVTPGLSTFAYGFEPAGNNAAKMLLEIIEQGRSQVSKLVLGFDWVPRESA
ncbi:LacI family DNA-binding transcriptional regulator [Photobacterium rosenbergii]|uniref:LacI family DNA-binding transcriptional regulator n=1 Tax=Photobacterium rosenbergii TaxID=294936 RepID=A0ABU3ZQF6_9GAMM|nr:LacI family DNA-binding transcriptional regulator [Photobacterium rosenbergii]MDV5172346.1 LacI family DNA-binding transcriptional regulator [Photobacterium rosenbergii]